jgi:broad specificity phosphatase PhoE
MKLYILRHEDRTQDATFFSPLTKKGLDNSIKLIEYLDDIDIDFIYSSPFIRTLQTIHPYAKKHNKKINIDYGIAEIQHPTIIPEKSYQVRLPEYLCESFNYNPKYNSSMEPENFEFPEDEHKLTKRVKNFLKKIMTDYCNKKCNVLLVSHQAVCNIILKIASKDLNSDEYKFDFTYNYPRGALSLIWDTDEWIIKPINWELNN